MATFEDLYQSMRNSDFDKFKELIKSNKSLLQYIDDEGNNLLMILLQYKGDVRYIPVGGEGLVILENDYDEPNMDILVYLIESGIDLDHFNNHNRNALMESFFWCDISMDPLSSLIKSGAGPFLKSNANSFSFEEYIIINRGCSTIVKSIYQKELEKQKLALQEESEQKLEEQKQFYEKKLIEQKERLLEELYRPDGLGYTVAKERFEKG